MSLQGSISIERMCQLAQVSRAGFYRSLQERQPLAEEMEVRRQFSRSCWNIGAATDIGESRRSYSDGEC